MATEEENQRLTRVGPGTPMGELLRRYWHPIAAAAALDAAPTKAVRLLGEDLVLYRDNGGRLGLISRACSHRSTDLANGTVEDYGLRCPFHGWLYDHEGRCLDQPLEPEPFCDQVTIEAYPVAVKAGLVWAYLGPAPAPLIPDWEALGWDDGLVQVVSSELPCNWLQCQEAALDPAGIATLPALDAAALRDHLAGRFEASEIEHGFVVWRETAEATRTAIGQEATWTCLWPNGLFAGNARASRFEWRVPTDDENTLIIARFFDRAAPGQAAPGGVYHWRSRVYDEVGEVITTHPLNRQYAVWVHQGRILDRTKESLVDSDWPVVMLRNRYLSQMDLIADGGEPKALVRDPRLNRRLKLPLAPADAALAARRRRGVAGRTRGFPLLAGQPADAGSAYEAVIRSWRRRARERPPRGGRP